MSEWSSFLARKSFCVISGCQPKKKGYQLVWVKNRPIFVRRADGTKAIRISHTDNLTTLQSSAFWYFAGIFRIVPSVHCALSFSFSLQPSLMAFVALENLPDDVTEASFTLRLNTRSTPRRTEEVRSVITTLKSEGSFLGLSETSIPGAIP